MEDDGHLIGCPECDLLAEAPVLRVGERARCGRCGFVLRVHYDDPYSRVLAYAIAGLVMLAIALGFTFLSISASGVTNSMTLIQTVSYLSQYGANGIALLVFVFVILVPLAMLMLMVVLSACLRQGVFKDFLLAPSRWLFHLNAWSMVEVVRHRRDREPGQAGRHGPGGVGRVFLGVPCVRGLFSPGVLRPGPVDGLVENRRAEGRRLKTANEAGLYSCHTCMALNQVGRSICRRCGSRVHERIPDSLQRTVALLIAAVVLYVPANVLPIMTTDQLGGSVDNTIIGGVILLWSLDSYPVAIVIFIASVLVPIGKILTVGALCWTVRWGGHVSPEQRTVLYRITEFIGKWSMVDVFVVAILVALIQITGIIVIRPGGAALAFAAVVILTMLAAENFDPRLIWDRAAAGNDP